MESREHKKIKKEAISKDIISHDSQRTSITFGLPKSPVNTSRNSSEEKATIKEKEKKNLNGSEKNIKKEKGQFKINYNTNLMNNNNKKQNNNFDVFLNSYQSKENIDIFNNGDDDIKHSNNNNLNQMINGSLAYKESFVNYPHNETNINNTNNNLYINLTKNENGNPILYTNYENYQINSDYIKAMSSNNKVSLQKPKIKSPIREKNKENNIAYTTIKKSVKFNPNIKKKHNIYDMRNGLYKNNIKTFDIETLKDFRKKVKRKNKSLNSSINSSLNSIELPKKTNINVNNFVNKKTTNNSYFPYKNTNNNRSNKSFVNTEKTPKVKKKIFTKRFNYFSNEKEDEKFRNFHSTKSKSLMNLFERNKIKLNITNEKDMINELQILKEKVKLHHEKNILMQKEIQRLQKNQISKNNTRQNNKKNNKDIKMNDANQMNNFQMKLNNIIEKYSPNKNANNNISNDLNTNSNHNYNLVNKLFQIFNLEKISSLKQEEFMLKNIENKNEDINENNYFKIFENNPQLRHFIVILCNKLKEEKKYREKLEEKTIELFNNDMKTIDMLEKKLKKYEDNEKSNSRIKDRLNRSADLIDTEEYYNCHNGKNNYIKVSLKNK